MFLKLQVKALIARVDQQRALLLVAHGSRLKASNSELRELTKKLAAISAELPLDMWLRIFLRKLATNVMSYVMSKFINCLILVH